MSQLLSIIVCFALIAIGLVIIYFDTQIYLISKKIQSIQKALQLQEQQKNERFHNISKGGF